MFCVYGIDDILLMLPKLALISRSLSTESLTLNYLEPRTFSTFSSSVNKFFFLDDPNSAMAGMLSSYTKELAISVLSLSLPSKFR